EAKHHQLYCRFRLKNNQKRFGLIKSIGWNIEVLNRLQCANKLTKGDTICDIELGNNPPGSSPPTVSKLPYLVCSSYRYASVNVSADDAYTPTVRGFLSAIFTDRDHT
ncbi:MAG: hypothetical protein WB988_18080, partial [Candidatus Nitrosopolaris sp.]